MWRRVVQHRLIPDQPISASIERADQAMYAAKRAGRNQLRVWREGMEERAADVE